MNMLISEDLLELCAGQFQGHVLISWQHGRFECTHAHMCREQNGRQILLLGDLNVAERRTRSHKSYLHAIQVQHTSMA